MNLALSSRLDQSVTDSPQTASALLPRLPEMVSPARDWLREVLTKFKVPAATIADAVQVISEFGQNAIRHVNTSGTDFDVMTVTAAVWDGHLKVTLSDPGVFADVPAELGGDLDEHGWGIGVIVAALSTCYGFEAVAGGKVAWATLEFGGAA